MTEIRFTLVGDGTSDRALLRVLYWVVRETGTPFPIQPQWADLAGLPTRPTSLAMKIRQAVELFPGDILFVHRDAERAAEAVGRRQEVNDAIEQSRRDGHIPRHVPVIPVRMTEAWLLFDEQAIRRAAGNPRGDAPLRIPRPWDAITDPKVTLHSALRIASGLNRRRVSTFQVQRAARQVPELTDDFSPLRSLAAFRELESETATAVAALVDG